MTKVTAKDLQQWEALALVEAELLSMSAYHKMCWLRGWTP